MSFTLCIVSQVAEVLSKHDMDCIFVIIKFFLMKESYFE